MRASAFAGWRSFYVQWMTDMESKLPKLIEQLLEESNERVNAWITSHADAIDRCDAEDIVMAQLAYATQRDAGLINPDPRETMCRQCGRMQMLELALFKLWTELQALRAKQPS